MTPPTVTIGLPFFNARATLADALRSIVAQTFTDWELLLIDDGSTDGSVDVARGLADPRVRLIADGVNRGLVARLNQIAELARGTYLARMDGDDLMHPRRLEAQLRHLAEQPAIDLLDAAAITIDEHGTPLGVRGEQPLNSDPRAVLRSGLLIHPAVLGRTAWFRAHPYDARFVRAEDLELWVRTCRTATFGRVPEPLLFYREASSGNLAAYLRTAQTTRAIVRAYGPAIVGRLRTGALIARSYAKGLTYWTMTRLGWQAGLIRHRSRPLGAAERLAARATLDTILNTPLPRPTHELPCSPVVCAQDTPAACLHGAADPDLPR